MANKKHKDWVILNIRKTHNTLSCEVCKAKKEIPTKNAIADLIDGLDRFMSQHIHCIETKEGKRWKKENQ